ncbi:MAG: helix-turn-helix domain containing protein [Flectobacillus sp.]|jgi:AcrR family transcriptional regulator|nr:helix-turn-helix domain containing protein [Flectobacillus sp.]
MEVKERIIRKATEMFFRYGVKSVTMDDISRELGISKKTLYLHFADKDELVYQMFSCEMENDECQWNDLQVAYPNVIERLLKENELMRDSFKDMNPSLLHDIKRFHPRTWASFEQHKKGFLLEQAKLTLQEGIKEEYFRADIEIDILAVLRIEQIELGFSTHLFPANTSILDIQLIFMDHFIRGILTKKGLEIYEHFKNKQ